VNVRNCCLSYNVKRSKLEQQKKRNKIRFQDGRKIGDTVRARKTPKQWKEMREEKKDEITIMPSTSTYIPVYFKRLPITSNGLMIIYLVITE